MKKFNLLFMSVILCALVTISRAEAPIVEKLLQNVDEKFNEELNDVDFSQDELKKLREMIHKGIKSKSNEELEKNKEIILKNSQMLLEGYQEQNTTCKANQETLGNQNYAKINKECFESTIKKLCPLYPFCE